MKDDFDAPSVATAGPDLANGLKADALHALGSFYLRQGYPRQGLSLLLAALDFGRRTDDLKRGLAHAYLLCGMPKQTLLLLDELDRQSPDAVPRGSRIMRARALLALGRVDEARRTANLVPAEETPPAPRRIARPTRRTVR